MKKYKLPYKGRLEWANESGDKEVLLIGEASTSKYGVRAIAKIPRKIKKMLGGEKRPIFANNVFEGDLTSRKNELCVRVKKIIPIEIGG